MKDWIFSLEALRPLLESYTPPDVVGDSGGIRYGFDLLSLTINPHKVGRLSFEVRNDSIQVRIDRPGEEGFRAFSEYRFRTDPGYLGIREWDARIWMAPKDQPSDIYPFTELKMKGSSDGRSVSISSGDKTRTETLEGPLVGKWTLLEFARRLSDPQAGAPLDFACLDEYQIIYPGHRLQPGAWLDAPGGFELRPFLHTGPGLIPRVLWVDRSERLIAYRTGTEAAVLTDFNGREGGYSATRYDLRKEKLSPELRR